MLRDRTPWEAKSRELKEIFPPGSVIRHNSDVLLFDERTPNLTLFADVKLYEFLSPFSYDRRHSRVGVKTLVVLERIWEEFDKRIRHAGEPKNVRINIKGCYIPRHEIRKNAPFYMPTKTYLEGRNWGWFVDLELSTRSAKVVKEFHKAIRRVNLYGGIYFAGHRVGINVCESKSYSEVSSP